MVTAGPPWRAQVFPSVARIRDVSEAVALATLQSTQAQGLASRIPPPRHGEDPDAALLAFLRRKTYDPFYVPLGIDPYMGAH